MDGINFGTYRGQGDLGEAVFDKVAAIPVFYKRAVLMPFASEQAGRPVSEQRDFVKLITPGERDEVDRQVEPADKRRWKTQWDAYKEGQSQEPDGTLLTHLFPGNPEIVENMKVLRFVTVEQLAEASDAALSSIPMGGLAWREKAKRFLEGSKDAGRFAAIERRQDEQDAALRTLRDEKALLAQENEALRAQLAERENAEPAPRAGRR